MKCIACGNEGITAGMSECPDCHFMIVNVVGKGDSSEYEAAMKDMAAEYVRELKEKIRLGLTAYSYKRVADSLELDEESELTIVDNAGQIPEEGIFWYDRDFARIESREPMELRIHVTSPEGRRDHAVKIAVPELEELWKIGVKGEPNLAFRIVVGKPELYTESGSISMVR